MGAHAVTDPRDEPVIEVWRRLGAPTPTALFEAVGVPGLLDEAMRSRPEQSEIVVVGVCMEPDTCGRCAGVVKELDVRFAFGYDPMEFAETLRRIAEGELDVAPLITGQRRHRRGTRSLPRPRHTPTTRPKCSSSPLG